MGKSLRANFTKSFLDKLASSEGKGRSYVYDERVKGLCLSITPNGVKSFMVYRKLNGRPIRVTLGRYPDISIEQARKMAAKKIGEIAEGANPVAKKRDERQRGITLGQVYTDYMTSRKGSHSENTTSNYNTIMNNHLDDWVAKPITTISRDMVERKHKLLSEASPSAANKAMRVLRALFNYAQGKYEAGNGQPLVADNPVKRLSHTKSWNKETRRQNTIKRSELNRWFDAVRDLADKGGDFNAVVSDYLLFVLFTGLRRREAANLGLDDLDFKEKVFTITKTKNGRPLTLPMSSYIEQLLKRRCLNNETGYVFPGEGGGKALNDPRRQIAWVREQSGVNFTIHDLRRTFITLAESLDISSFALKALVNHSSGSDVTAGYIIMDVERLRKPMEQVTRTLLGFIRPTGSRLNVVSISSGLPAGDL